MTRSARIAVAAVRTWTHLYTFGLPSRARETRCAEIESDLWECLADTDAARSAPLQIAGRLVLGIPDDLRWRAESVTGRSRAARIAVALGVMTALLASVWIGLAARPGKAPDLPDAPDLRWRPRHPPPPPPPPPPPF